MNNQVHSEAESNDISKLRQDLAAAFRLCHQFGWSESVGNHFSAAASRDGRRFLLNSCWQHFATIRASDLMLLNADDPDVMTGPNPPDASAWTIHGAMHRLLPEARVILHCHSPYAVALSCLKDPALLPLDNNTARFTGRTAYDLNFSGIADAEREGLRLAESMKGKSILVMGNHGVTITGKTVADAFEDLYFFEKAAQTMILALSSGKPLAVMSEEVAQQTADGWDSYRGMAQRHFDYLKSTLDAADPSWRE